MTKGRWRRRLLPAALAVVAVFASSALTGCASVLQETGLEDQGPTLSVQGRISVRQVAKPLLIGSYEWHRGTGFDGWTERFVLRSSSGQRVFLLSSDDRGTVVQYLDSARRVESMRWLIKDQLGVDIAPATLADWLENRHQGDRLPDSARHEGVRVDVIERDREGKPSKIRLVQDETIILMTVRRELA